MNPYDRSCCHPHHKRKSKKNCNHKKIGLAMLLLGVVTVLALCLPMKYWVLLLSGALIIFGIMIIKSR